MGTKALLICILQDAPMIIDSINRLRPECLCFFTTEEGKNIINNTIIPALRERPIWMAEITTEDPHDLMICYKSLRKKWGDLQKNWYLQPGDWMIDYSDSTSSMAIAAMIVSLPVVSRQICMARSNRSDKKISIGEHIYALYETNIWDELAIRERVMASRSLKRSGYGRMAMIFKEITYKVSGGQKQLYKTLADIAEGYALWDNFQYKKAWEKLKPSHRSLQAATLFGGPPGMGNFVQHLERNLRFLERLSMGFPGLKPEHVYDMIANARRRVELERRYEDGTIRLIRAMELYGGLNLSKDNIDPHNVNPEKIPSSLREEFTERYKIPGGNIDLPLYGMYRLLKGLDNPAGMRFFEQWPRLRLILDNMSKTILMGGIDPVSKERYEELVELVYKICNIREEDIPQFPSFNF